MSCLTLKACDVRRCYSGNLALAEEPKKLKAEFEEFWKAELAKEKPSLTKVFIKIIGCQTIVTCMLCAIGKAVFLTITPFVSKAIIDSFQSEEEVPIGTKVAYVLMLSLFPFFGALCDSQLNFRGRRASIHLYETFTMAIYTKSLRLSSGKVSSFCFLQSLWC